MFSGRFHWLVDDGKVSSEVAALVYSGVGMAEIGKFGPLSPFY